ncbi:WD domain, G-beta repeat family protein [Theileria equi strain WA]|uniref:WD domain, G-beta repeat family protein n=1 Tax=Theileria equi strain WA TaxID=1537102 RepID=L0AXS5_THEEQ|nr:WD domain, G-beta repeat family protein [Theileria equi strain WA]AFZ80053.1 WD domain, G-beta repeat family protein [Theileria equi strain WA]|eukprot:XP_004829719.1 WD domain, G-beta repeat family protein [Theileria equi strain WA]
MARVSNWDTETSNLDGEVLKELELKSKLSNLYIGVTTNDSVVKKIFRSLKEPIILFGEGSYERRERLKMVLLNNYDKFFHEKDVDLAIASSTEAKNFYEVLKLFNIDMSNVYKKGNFLDGAYASHEDANDRELFYTEGDDDVRLFRRSIAYFSWNRSLKRKAMIHKYRSQCDQYEHKDYVERFGEYITQNLSLSFSQLAADRPLTMAKFSPNVKYIATGSYCNDVGIFDFDYTKSTLVKKLTTDCKEMIHCLDWNFNSSNVYYDGKEPDDITDDELLLVTGGSGGTMALWKPFSKIEETKIYEFKIHEAKINRILFHPCNTVVASSSADETIRLYDIEVMKEIYLQEGHKHAVYALSINGDGNLMASGDSYGVMLIFDLRTGRHIFQQSVHNGDITGISFHPITSHIFATSSADNSVKIFDLRKFKPITSLLSHTKLVSGLEFEPIYGRYLATSSFDTHVKIWDTSDYKCRKVLSNDDTRIMGINIAPDASAIVAAGYDRAWRLFKPKEDQEIDTEFALYKVLYG